VWTLPYEAAALASRLPGKALSVWMLAQHQAKLDGSLTVAIPNRRLKEFGVSRYSYLRARQQLEQAGLILTQSSGRGRGHVSIIELVPLPEDEPE
jgi:hypothetical protein